jgi:hypothetical protein
MALPNGHKRGLKDVWFQLHERADIMELGQVLHQMIPWILAIEDYLGNSMISALQKYGLNTYHDF